MSSRFHTIASTGGYACVIPEFCVSKISGTQSGDRLRSWVLGPGYFASRNSGMTGQTEASSCTLKRDRASVHTRRGCQPAERAKSWNCGIEYL